RDPDPPRGQYADRFCSCQKLLPSNALAGAAMPANSVSAASIDAIVFIAILLQSKLATGHVSASSTRRICASLDWTGCTLRHRQGHMLVKRRACGEKGVPRWRAGFGGSPMT